VWERERLREREGESGDKELLRHEQAMRHFLRLEGPGKHGFGFTSSSKWDICFALNHSAINILPPKPPIIITPMWQQLFL
jgi:hypothetical protein